MKYSVLYLNNIALMHVLIFFFVGLLVSKIVEYVIWAFYKAWKHGLRSEKEKKNIADAKGWFRPFDRGFMFGNWVGTLGIFA